MGYGAARRQCPILTFAKTDIYYIRLEHKTTSYWAAREQSMPFELPLPTPFKEQGWKAKIQEKERVEEPHVAIIFKTKRWRFGLRRRTWLDKLPKPKEVPKDVVKAIMDGMEELCREWDKKYPLNPVSGVESEEKNDE